MQVLNKEQLKTAPYLIKTNFSAALKLDTEIGFLVSLMIKYIEVRKCSDALPFVRLQQLEKQPRCRVWAT